ncbi:MAG: hypothetical protein ABR569_05110 [Gaiellaceae bacterium]
MRLDRILLSCDLNPDYLEFWPSTRRAWEEIVGVAPILVLVAPPDQIPDDLQRDDAVVPFAPIADVHPTLQAQCIRLLYPALLDTDGAVLISDIDLYPLKRSYFVDPIALLDASYFVTYRDTRLDRNEVNITFNAAAPATWAEIFDVRDIDQARRRLQEWAGRTDYDGRRGWAGWYTDQEILYERLHSWPARAERLWTLDDDYCGFNRLDRLELEHENGLERHRRRALAASKYSDYNCLLPYHRHRGVNDAVLEIARSAAQRRRV